MNRRRRVTSQWLNMRSEATEEEERERYFLFLLFMFGSGLRLILFFTIVIDTLIPMIATKRFR